LKTETSKERVIQTFLSYSNGATIGAPSSFSFTNAALGTSGCTMDGVFEATTDVDVWQ
jgi:hypothetical protein